MIEANIQHVNPPTLFASSAFSQTVAASGGTTVYLAGQLPLDDKPELVGKNDPEAQVRRVFENVRLAVEAHGGTIANIVQMTLYIVDQGDRFGQVNGAARRTRKEIWGDASPPAVTVVGVSRLTLPDAMLEVDAVAVVG